MNEANKKAEKLDHLPAMPDLSVIRDTYCSQKMTDQILSYMWEKKPDLLLKMMNHEQISFLVYDHTRYCPEYVGTLSRFLQNEVTKNMEIPATDLGKMDLFFELSRRLRKVRGLPEYKIPGKPLSDGSNGPFPPELPHLPVSKAPFGLSQEQIDTIIDEAYRRKPHLFWEIVEYMRRGSIYGWGARNELTNLYKDLLPDSIENPDLSSLYEITYESYNRLKKICGIPSEAGAK